MGAFVVDVAALAEAVEQMAALDRTVEGHRGLVNHAAKRLETSWTGEAAAAAQEAHTRWQAGAKEMGEALKALHAVMVGAHKNYSAAVAKNSQMWGAAP